MAGQALQEQGSDFLSIQVEDNIKDLSAFELVLNNWRGGGGGTPGFKYTNDENTITLGRPVEVQLGYADAPALARMMDGRGHGDRTGLPLDRRADNHHSRPRPAAPDAQPTQERGLARENQPANPATIASQNGLTYQCDGTGPSQPLVPQDNMDDIAFFSERAKHINFEVFMKDGRFYFVKSREGQDPLLELEWGTSLVSFSPSLTLSKQVSKVTVRSWHPSEGRLVEKTAERSQLSDISQGGTDAAQVLDAAFGASRRESSPARPSSATRTRSCSRTPCCRDELRVHHRHRADGGHSVAARRRERAARRSRYPVRRRLLRHREHPRIDSSGYTTGFTVRKVYA